MEPLPGIALDYRRTVQNREADLKFRRKLKHPFCSGNVRDKPAGRGNGSQSLPVALAESRIATRHAAPKKAELSSGFVLWELRAFRRKSF